MTHVFPYFFLSIPMGESALLLHTSPLYNTCALLWREMCEVIFISVMHLHQFIQ